jgi:hypothetical protein
LALVRYEGRVHLIEIEHEMARLDAIYRPVATKPANVNDPDAFINMGAPLSGRTWHDSL